MGYPFGKDGVLNLSCAARRSAAEELEVEVITTAPLELVVRWEGGQKTMVSSGG
jgi:hypothetical protein